MMMNDEDEGCGKLWIRILLEEMKYLVFSFSRSGNEARYKRGVVSRHSTRNAFKIRRKMWNGTVTLPFRTFRRNNNLF